MEIRLKILVYYEISGLNIPLFDVVENVENINNYKPSFEALSYAVRSSCSLEDSDSKSFAGQFSTFLNVSKEELNSKIIECFDSMSDENIQKYGIKESYSKSVIVQEMVQPDVSGILFTSNPQGLLNESVIVCGKGIGENVVSDKTNTTSYYYNKTDDIYYYEGTEDLLEKNKIQELLDLSKKIESILGKYLDIEFVIKNDEIYILQARRITTINDDNILILDNSNIVESYPGVSLPLTISFVHKIYSGVFRSGIYRILKSEKELEKLKDIFNNMVGDCNGRIYYKISNWYEIIIRLPFSKKIIPIWQDMMGVKEHSVVTNSKYKKASIKVYINFLKEIKNVPKSMEQLNNYFDELYEEYKKIDLNSLNYEETIELFNKYSKILLSKWDITLFNDMYTFIYTGMLKNKLKKKCEDYEEVTNNLICGNKSLESLKPIQMLINIALDKENISQEDYKKRFDSYIELYGDRALEELKLETKTFRTNPELLERKIEEFCNNKEKLQELLNGLNENEKGLQDYNSNIQKTIEKCKLGIKNREKSRLNRTRIFGMFREMLLRLGTLLAENQLIDEQRDVFYLTLDELSDGFNKNYKKLVSERKEEYKLYYKLPSYSRLVFSEHEFNKRHLSINNEEIESSMDILRGVPCSSGVCDGEVVVVDSQNKDVDVKDKIIVTKMTDPGFVFLIANAKGIISEKGSILSHTAIITRELKVPSIVGVKDLLKNIKTGDRIHMDANNGTISFI